MSKICISFLVLFCFLAGCALVSNKNFEPEGLTFKEMEEYYELAKKAYNDSSLWETFGKEKPVEFKPHWDPDISPAVIGGPGYVEASVLSGKEITYPDTIWVYIPVESIGENLGGVPFVVVEFHYPSRKIKNIGALHRTF